MWYYTHIYELYHHGIKGQRWGVRNGPPYPLGGQTRKRIRRTASEMYRNVASMTVGDIKTAHRSNVKKILNSAKSRKKIDSLLNKENVKYKKALLYKEQTDKEKYQNDSSYARKEMAKKVLITAGVLTVASLAAYVGYKHGKEIKDFIDEAIAKDKWLNEQVAKGLTGRAKILKNAYKANQYNTANLFDKNAWDSLTALECSSVKLYTGISYGDMNNALRTGTLGTTSENIRDLVQDCTSALEKSILKEDVFVHRGVDANSLSAILGVDSAVLKDANQLARLKNQGHIFTEKGFSSTAGSSDDAWAGVKMHIFAPKGTKGIYVDPISMNKGEHEFLLQRNTRFRIDDFRLDKSGNITDLMLAVIDQIIN